MTVGCNNRLIRESRTIRGPVETNRYPVVSDTDFKKVRVNVRRAAWGLFVVAALGLAAFGSGQNADVLRGTVINVDSVPIPNATVTVL